MNLVEKEDEMDDVKGDEPHIHLTPVPVASAIRGQPTRFVCYE